MRKADVVLAVLAVLLVAVTAVAGLSGDRWTEERTLRFTSLDGQLAPQGPTPAGGGGADFNWTLPANSTAANVTVDLAFSGQAIRGGSATVSVRLTSPDGRAHPPVTQSWTIPQGATSSTFSLNVAVEWMATPGTTRDTTTEGHGMAWDGPLAVSVVVQRPADLPLAQYAFTASVSGSFDYYQLA